MEVTEQKKSYTYSWGPLYETMKEMDTDYKDEVIQKGFALFKELDNTYSWINIKSIVEKTPLTVYEQNKLNSSCLDGILLTYLCNSPLNKIIIDYPTYVDTFRFYLSKETDTLDRGTLSLIAITNRLELFACLEDKHFEHYYQPVPQPENWERFTCKKILFEKACVYGNLEMAKLTYADSITNDKDFYNFCYINRSDLANYPNIVEFLLEKNIQLDEEIVDNALRNACEREQIEIVRKFLSHDKVKWDWYLLWSLARFDECLEIVEILIQNKTKSRINVEGEYPIRTYSDKMAKLLTKYGIPILPQNTS